MYECDAHRLFELKLGHVGDHSLYTFNGFIDGEGGVVVIFQVEEQYRSDVFGDDKVESVLPVDVEAKSVVIAALYIIIKGVEHRGVGDAFTNGPLVIDDCIHTDGRGNVLSRNPNAVLVIIAFLDAEATFVGQFLVHHEGDFAGQRAHVYLMAREGEEWPR